MFNKINFLFNNETRNYSSPSSLLAILLVWWWMMVRWLVIFRTLYDAYVSIIIL